MLSLEGRNNEIQTIDVAYTVGGATFSLSTSKVRMTLHNR